MHLFARRFASILRAVRLTLALTTSAFPFGGFRLGWGFAIGSIFGLRPIVNGLDRNFRRLFTFTR